MSTTGNEYEQPGVNYPDRNDADGATDTPGAGEPARAEQPAAAPTMGEPAEDAEPAGTWTEAPEQGGTAAPSPTEEGGGAGSPTQDGAGAGSPTQDGATSSASEVPGAHSPAPPAQGAAATGPSEGARSGEPSHEAVGIGVLDDGADHHGHDEGRDTMTASEAQQTPGALGTEQEQRLPAMAQNNASDLEKVTGIVAQTRQDVGTEPLERIAEVLRQRLDQSGIDLPDADVQELARQVSTGDADSPTQPGRDDSA
ncbi:hypothetical protein [Microbacterium hibisci]|uniref:hypothetical protein n=1 Tax=Microbacterium hibisci TaxID=2036000 RepID=UPI001944DC18|nr:hypothetical protein [Microbacterium hibisci]